MDFNLSEEQTMLQDSVSRFVQNSYGFDDRKKYIAAENGFSAENWATFAELGWLGIPFAEEHGGFGGGALEIMTVMEEFGKGLVVEPYLATVILGGGFLSKGGTAAQQEQLIPSIIEGNLQLAFAYVEPQGRFNLADITTTATASGDGYSISGHKGVVLNGPNADKLIVTTRTSGDQRDENGITVFLVDASAAGVSRRNYPTIDAMQGSEITFNDVQVSADDIIGELNNGLALIQSVVDDGLLAICAEAVGAMEVLYKTTVEYTKQRKQFDVPIGSFQALQHRMVDMFIEHEQSKSLMYLAAMRLAEGSDEASKAISALKVQIGKGGRYVGQQAVQLHGGMGQTEELNVGHYFKRLTMISHTFGNADFHLNRFGEL